MNKLNCFDAMILSAGNILLPHCNLDYYFLDAFSIKYYKVGLKKSDYDESVKSFVESNILKDYYGLLVTREVIHNKNAVAQKIEDVVYHNLKPIGIQMDSFYLPWNSLQFQKHRTHCFLITEIENDGYVCVDAFLSDNKVRIDKKTLIDNTESFFYFNYDEKIKKDNDLQCITSFIKGYICVERKEHIEKIENFADDILNSRCEKIDTTNSKSIDQSNLIFSIANIEWRRNNFSSALKLAKKNFNTSLFDEIITKLDEIYVMWGTVKSILIKNAVVNNGYNNKASQLVQKIANKEDEVMLLLLNLNS